jgi:hypothetical protein
MMGMPVSARFRAISSELEGQDVSAMPKERLLALLESDRSKYGSEARSQRSLDYLERVQDLVDLVEEVKKHPWDDCAKFLAERGEILQAIERTKAVAKTRPNLVGSSAGPAIATRGPLRLAPYGRVIKDRVITKSDVERGRWGDEGYSGARGMMMMFFDSEVREEDRRYYKQDYSGRVETLRYPPRPSPSEERLGEVLMGFGPMNILAGSTMILQVMPQFSFRCTRLLIGSMTAPHFAIVELRSGGDSIMNMNPIPATAFTENVVGVALGMDVVAGLQLMMAVLNTSQESRTFAATLSGTRS